MHNAEGSFVRYVRKEIKEKVENLRSMHRSRDARSPGYQLV